MARIGVVEDEAISREMLVSFLSGAGHAVEAYADAAAVRERIVGQMPDLLLLDLYMPGEDGLSLLRWLRGFSEIPVIMLTSADSTADRVIGLELGADDYLSKPFDTRELLARIRTVLRRRPVAGPDAAPAPQLKINGHTPGSWFGRWRLDFERRRLVDPSGIEMPITGQEFALLQVFAEHPRVVLSREKLLELSGTDPAEVFDRAIDLRITRLRKKIEPVPGDPTVIRTVRGHGGGYEYVPGDGPSYGR